MLVFPVIFFHESQGRIGGHFFNYFNGRRIKRLEMLRTKPELKQNLWKIVNALQSGLNARGFDIGTTQSCVTPQYI